MVAISSQALSLPSDMSGACPSTRALRETWWTRVQSLSEARTMRKYALGLAFAMVMLPAVAGAPLKCPTDNSALTATGRTKFGTLNGKAQLLKEYACSAAARHTFWVGEK